MTDPLIEKPILQYGIVGVLMIGLPVASYRYGGCEELDVSYDVVPNIVELSPHTDYAADMSAFQDLAGAVSTVTATIWTVESLERVADQTNSSAANDIFVHPVWKR